MKKLFTLFVFIVLFGGIIGVGYTFFKDMDGPTIAITPDTGSMSLAQNITLQLADSGSGVQAVSVSVRKGSQSAVALEHVFPSALPQASVSFNLKNTGLRDGEFDMDIRVTDASMAGFGRGNTSTRTLHLKMDTVPPGVSVRSAPGAAGRRGSIAAVSYTVSEDVQQTGVRVGEEFFPAFRQPSGVYYCMLAFPITMTTTQFVPEIIARDLAGNESRSRILLPAQDRKYREDTLGINDQFLDSKMPAFINLVPDAPNNLERYVRVNNEVRLSNEQTLREISKDTAPTMLWSGTFMRLPAAAPRAAFGDHRTYKYGDKVIDHQTHMGLDLASVKHAPVPAANTGRVVFAGDLGIFGNLVVVDHGLGLMTLYSHMSSISVSKGAQVNRGDTLGNTGVTGLAGGDHLHFGVMLHGIQMQPLDWFDKNWIKNNITDRLHN